MSRSSQPLVSVVTPVYNAQAFLAECIESVLGQSYQRWEYVIVDNCSTDGSRAIAEHYARSDARIRLHTNDRFLTAWENQNHALTLISPCSAYCKVVHADDWLFPRCLEEMAAVADAHPAVGIVGAYRLDGTRVNLDGIDYRTSVFSGREICRRSLLGELYVFGSPSSLLIRSDLVRGRAPFYTETKPWKDVSVCYELLQTCDFGFVHQVLTFSRRHAGAESFNAAQSGLYEVGKLASLVRFGAVFLPPDEYERRLRTLLDEYYRFLVRHVLMRRDRALWEFHRSEARALGLLLSPLALSRMSAAMALGTIGRPFRTLVSALRS